MMSFYHQELSIYTNMLSKIMIQLIQHDRNHVIYLKLIAMVTFYHQELRIYKCYRKDE
jgi:hypothetical protein